MELAMKLRRILIPLDLSERSSRALDAAARVADPACIITLLHVIAEIEGVPADELADFYAGLRAHAEPILQRRAEQLAALGLQSRIEITVGRRGAEILREAEEQGSDLIVLSTHRVDPGRPGGGLGTLSHQVALLAPCDVLLVR
jgi:nucleotide-binding universal stress UspA family protein